MPRTVPPPQTGDHLSDLVNRFAGCEILVVGDLILDRYLWGDVERTSPEAPVPVVRLRRQTQNLGGAANVVANLAALGARPRLIGVIGNDEDSAAFRELLGGIGVDARDLIVDRGRPMTVKSRVVCQNQQMLRLDQEEPTAFSPDVAARIIGRFERLLAKCRLVVFSDYDKGVLAPELCRTLLQLARAAGKPVVVDPKGTDYAKYRGAEVITPNLKEAQAASGMKIDSPESLGAAAKALQRTVGGKAVVITRGPQGVAVFEKGRPVVEVPAQALAVFDVTGAGDSLIAAMSAALAAGAGVADAARLGNAAGSIAVSRIGAATVTPEELIAALQPGTGHKLRSPRQLAAELAVHRAAGRRIVLTNGFFDLLHLGHLKFLQQARRLGDVLIVAINSDRSVRAIKGPPRPVLDEQARAGLLSALDTVDYVVVFDEETPEALLEVVRPDVLVKGRSMTRDEVVGREIVERHGGRVEILATIGSATTDGMLERIARESSR